MRPSTYTCLPFVKYCERFSARHRTTFVQFVSSFHSPDCWSFQRRFVATLNFVTDVCDAVYATSGYQQSSSNMQRVSLSSDMVFSDGVSLQTPSMTGNAQSGYVSSLVVGVSGTV